MELLRYPEVAARLRMSVWTARRLGAAGKILEVRPSPGILRVTAESVDLHLHRHLGPKRKVAA